MSKKGGAPNNLDPVRSKDEAKKRGRNGGIKSGEVRRNKRDAKAAMKLLLNMAAKGTLDKSLEQLGVDESDRTNMLALQARLFQSAMNGDLKAYDKVMTYAGYNPEENRKERESLAADSRKTRETDARIAHLEKEGQVVAPEGEDPFGDEEKEDVIIVLPDDGRNKPEEPTPEVVETQETDGGEEDV